MGTEQECIAWIRERLKTVDSLLSNPETGIGTWHLMYGKEMQAIADYWLHGWEFAKAKYEGKAAQPTIRGERNTGIFGIQ